MVKGKRKRGIGGYSSHLNAFSIREVGGSVNSSVCLSSSFYSWCVYGQKKSSTF